MRGKIKHFNDEKKYGFIGPDAGGGDIFFHVSDIPKGTKTADNALVGRDCSYEVGEGTRGPKAVSIQLV